MIDDDLMLIMDLQSSSHLPPCSSRNQPVVTRCLCFVSPTVVYEVEQEEEEDVVQEEEQQERSRGQSRTIFCDTCT